MSIRLGIVGSRYYNNYEMFEKYVKEWIGEKKIDYIISGGAEGVDSLAKIYANKHNIKFIEYLPEWNKYGKKAGPIRNQKIIDEVTHLLAFPQSNSIGTYDSINKAKIKKILVTIVNI